MSIFSVSEAKEKALAEKFQALNIREEDIAETFIRSSGKGGQHVNKTSTCVYLKHLPTGIEVKCQQERSQSLNRYRARVVLAKKIEQTGKRPGERGNTADREAPATKKEAVKKGKGQDARRQKDRFRKEETAQPSC